MHRTAQARERTGYRQGDQQAEQGQHDQGDAQGAEWPKQAVAVPGIEVRVRNAIDQQVGFAGFRAGVFGGEAAPGQFALIIGTTCFECGGTARKGAGDHGVAIFIEHLHVDVKTPPTFLEKFLRIFGAIAFITFGPRLGQGVEARMTAENPRILVEHVPEQDRQPGNERDGQPEAGKDAPEQ
ncbi:hypothetical protein D3C86_1604710 [compost metagenome]